jgi:NADPH:quinone reductase-like Zn-dependent oxidoreductase
VIDGTLREYGVFNEQGLVKAPRNLDAREASTLSCAALTSWNALYGLKPLKPGQVVLVQGTGGVSMFGLQVSGELIYTGSEWIRLTQVII